MVGVLTVWRRLESVAADFLRRTELGLSVSGRLYLTRLLIEAARTVEQDGKANDADALFRADEAVRSLLATAGGLAWTEGPGEAFGFFLGAAVGGERGRITAAKLKKALRELCPIWPICKAAR
jgi:hypothetical protein